MIRERSNSAMIRALGFDPSSTLVVASKEGTIARHNSVKYEIYAAIASSAFRRGSTVIPLLIALLKSSMAENYTYPIS
jgi:hypothetical protein